MSLDAVGESACPATCTCSNCGFFVSTDGHVLTGLFGVAGSAQITVRCADGRRAEARVLAIDQPANLALLETDLSETVPLEMAGAPPDRGELVVLAALHRYEGRLQAGVLPGMIASVRASVRFQGVKWQDLLVASLSPPAGDAAAPLLTTDGRLAAIVLGAAESTASTPARFLSDGACLALPVTQLRPILDRLLRGESRQLGWLGVRLVREPGDREGALVGAVLEGSPAHEAGIRPGDVLLQIGSQPLQDIDALARSVAEGGPRKGVKISVLRDGNVRAIAMDIGPRPLLMWAVERDAGEAAPPRPAPHGSTVQQLRRENRELREHIRSLQEQLRELNARTQ